MREFRKLLIKYPDLTVFLPLIYFASLLILYFFKRTNVYFSVDPESQFYSNALLILTGHHTAFIDHPGTMFQVWLAFLMAPFRLDFIISHTHESFIIWWLKNADIIWGIYRFFNVILYLFGFIFILKSARKLTESGLVVIGTFLFIIAQSFFNVNDVWYLRFGTESMIFIILGIWLYLAVKLSMGELDEKYIWFLPFLAGLGLANRSHFLALPIASLIFILNNKRYRKDFETTIASLYAIFAVIISGFIMGTIPGIPRYYAFFNYMGSLIFHTGTHGSGSATVFNPDLYFQSFLTHLRDDPLQTAAIAVLPVVYYFFPENRLKNITLKRLYISLFTGGLVAFLVASKYPEVHYEFINYSIFAFLISLSLYLIPKSLDKYLTIFMMILLIIVSGLQFNAYASYFDVANRTGDFITKYRNPSAETIWTYSSPSREYGLIMGNIFSGQYGQELSELYPRAVNMDGTPKIIYDFFGKTYDKRQFCWQSAFIPGFMLGEFTSEYGHPDELTVVSSPDKDLYFIRRLTCKIA